MQHNIIYQSRLSGLTQALTNVQTYCTNTDLERDYKDQIQEKIAKVNERQQELEQAKYDGKQSKIIEKQHKLEEAQSELEQAKQTLAAFYQALQ